MSGGKPPAGKGVVGIFKLTWLRTPEFELQIIGCVTVTVSPNQIIIIIIINNRSSVFLRKINQINLMTLSRRPVKGLSGPQRRERIRSLPLCQRGSYRGRLVNIIRLWHRNVMSRPDRENDRSSVHDCGLGHQRPRPICEQPIDGQSHPGLGPSNAHRTPGEHETWGSVEYHNRKPLNKSWRRFRRQLAVGDLFML